MIETGTYAPRNEVQVIYWPKPDKNGSGDVVWRNRQDSNGNNVGRDRVRDSDGNEVKNYPVPEGFRNFPSFDHTPHFLLVNDETGDPWRDKDGSAVEIEPGTALVIYPDKTVEVLRDEWEAYQFVQRYEKTSGNASANDMKNDQDQDRGTDEEPAPVDEPADTPKPAKAVSGGKNK